MAAPSGVTSCIPSTYSHSEFKHRGESLLRRVRCHYCTRRNLWGENPGVPHTKALQIAMGHGHDMNIAMSMSMTAHGTAEHDRINNHDLQFSDSERSDANSHFLVRLRRCVETVECWDMISQHSFWFSVAERKGQAALIWLDGYELSAWYWERIWFVSYSLDC
jgi:hypothetical protein